jgi:outer membrane receptor for ferrienterochelin and colicin
MVPLHAFSSKIGYQVNKDLTSSLLITYKGRTRDYGSTNVSFYDQILDEYFLIDLKSSYNLSNDYKLDFLLKNLFDKSYEDAFEYSGTPRTINISLKRAF